MSRSLLLVPVAALVAVPLVSLPSAPLGWLAVLGGGLCATGVLGRSIVFTAAGAMTAVLIYGLGLWIAAAPPDIAGAIVLGTSLFLVLDGTAVAHRFHRASVHRSALRAELTRWAIVAAAAPLTIVMLDVLARALVFAAPAPVHAALAGLAAVAVVLGITRLVQSHGDSRSTRS